MHSSAPPAATGRSAARRRGRDSAPYGASPSISATCPAPGARTSRGIPPGGPARAVSRPGRAGRRRTLGRTPHHRRTGPTADRAAVPGPPCEIRPAAPDVGVVGIPRDRRTPTRPVRRRQASISPDVGVVGIPRDRPNSDTTPERAAIARPGALPRRHAARVLSTFDGRVGRPQRPAPPFGAGLPTPPTARPGLHSVTPTLQPKAHASRSAPRFRRIT
jgi:hypothetical protein